MAPMVRKAQLAQILILIFHFVVSTAQVLLDLSKCLVSHLLEIFYTVYLLLCNELVFMMIKSNLIVFILNLNTVLHSIQKKTSFILI